MPTRCHSACVHGLDGAATEVEVHNSGTNPRFDVVGLPDAAGREARDRVRAAIKNSGYWFPEGAVVVNLAPAAIPKSGAGHDLPMALGILAVSGVVRQSRLEEVLQFGELALDGRLRPVRGAFLLATTAAPRGLTSLLVPPGNAREAALASDAEVHAPRSLRDAVAFLNGQLDSRPIVAREQRVPPRSDRDFAEVKGQETVKTALIVAAAGGHNALLVGPPGAGKSLLAERFPDVLPPLAREEALEVARVHSAAGLPVDGLPVVRPMRAPSCGASPAGVLGGGSPPRPGEASLSHRGVLFLDEFPHFLPEVLEILRQPLDTGLITISRARGHFTFPARFQLLSAMNPCPCGFRGSERCDCTPPAVERYLRRLSGPLLDRIDLRVKVRAVSYAELRDGARSGMTTELMRAQVARGRAVQRERFGDPSVLNASMGPDALRRHCPLDAAGHRILESACGTGDLTARGVARVLRVARTIADLADRERIQARDLHIALQWRLDADL
jgi:magnesium chelatase family protein